MKQFLIAILLVSSTTGMTQAIFKPDSTTAASEYYITDGHVRGNGFVSFGGDAEHFDFKWLIDSGKVRIIGDTIAGIRNMAKFYMSEKNWCDSLKLLVERILASIGLNAYDTCSEIKLKKALRAYGRYAYGDPKAFTIGRSERAYPCSPAKKAKANPIK